MSHCVQKFGSIRADVIEQMRFKQRLRVIQTIEDTTKRNVVITHSIHRHNKLTYGLRMFCVSYFKGCNGNVLSITGYLELRA